MTHHCSAAITFCAASAIVSALMIGRPDSASSFLPRSSLVPFMRTTSGKKMLKESGLPIISADTMAEAATKIVAAVQ